MPFDTLKTDPHLPRESQNGNTSAKSVLCFRVREDHFCGCWTWKVITKARSSLPAFITYLRLDSVVYA
ncbi:hypothetical protein ANN_01257 [Periplaneta americana]|uniref:Uncharacterized protein n=1 Tax=Periplaneta americana TaxID=6978 RepID=A0ABQ8TVH4_PERAM|nr:hypothetical protein ANN_01257 [Periplaneta americana]